MRVVILIMLPLMIAMAIITNSMMPKGEIICDGCDDACIEKHLGLKR